MSEPTAPQRLSLGAYRMGHCDACGRHFTDGVGVAGPDGDLLFSLCQWCMLAALDLATGFDITQQVISWYTWKKRYRRYKELGWSKKARNRPPGEIPT